MSTFGSSRGSRGDPLQKRIPRNPKFDHIKATVNSGDSVSRQMDRIERKGENVKVRPNELYRRMKITTFVQLIMQIADIDETEEHPTGVEDRPLRGYEMNRPNTADTERAADEEILAVYGRRQKQDSTQQPQFRSVFTGVGEMDVQKPSSIWSWSYDSSCPYLLLDVRPPEEYEKFHIVTALNYPSAMLARSINYETKELLAYRNKEGRLIIVYDDEEHVAPMVAKTLCERGYDNIFLLTGGMKLGYRLFPKAFIADGGHADPRGFSREAITALEVQLDSIFTDHSVGSRLTRQSTVASRTASTQALSSRMSNSAKVVAGRPPFKPA